MANKINLKVLVLDTDFYARRALNSYLAWDRRTRVIGVVDDVERAFEFIQNTPLVELPDLLIMEAEACPDANALHDTIRRFRATAQGIRVICLARTPDASLTQAAAKAGACAYLLRNEARLGLVNVIVSCRENHFVVTPAIQHSAVPPYDGWLSRAELMPSERELPEMTDRIRQALWLCVIEGMPAQLAADEMGISPHTIRSYIKEGYRILEAHDDNEYPEEMGPIERAFMRFTALNDPDIPEDTPEDKHAHQDED